MGYELDSFMGFDTMGLYYEVHMESLDGESFHYNVYFEEGDLTEKYSETEKVIGEFVSRYEENNVDLGKIAVTREEDKVLVCLELGSGDDEYADTAIKGILKALNRVRGIEKVTVNERIYI